MPLLRADRTGFLIEIEWCGSDEPDRGRLSAADVECASADLDVERTIGAASAGIADHGCALIAVTARRASVAAHAP